MCGIAGWIDWEVDLTQRGHILEGMVKTMARRGPDAEGFWLSPRAAIGHRRLSVVDPQGGRQPMIRTLGQNDFVLTYNGELYNTAELREELKDRGHRFSTWSDTEVLLVAYIEWGPGCVERLNGIYAFAVWDGSRRELFMARDRLGVKPLYYTALGSAFIFGSELKALLAHPLVKPRVGPEGLAEIFALGPSRTPGHGIFKDVQELRPGHTLTCNISGVRVSRYWQLKSLEHPHNLEQTTQRVQELFRDTVERQLVADVPVCTLLSGGLDSSAITAFAARAFKEGGAGPLHTYSVDYVDNDIFFKESKFQPDSDSPWVNTVSDFLGTTHHRVLVDTPALVQSLQEAVLARDLPGMADVDSSLLLFCREVKKEATVALSGECADEIFGGYPWYDRNVVLGSHTFPWLRNVREKGALLSEEFKSIVNLQEYIDFRYRESLAEVPRLPGEDSLSANMREMYYLNLNWFMVTLLERKDRMSMYCGLEVRVPFCDHRLVEYAWNIPWQIKNCDGRQKGILRRALRGFLPQEVLYRPKSPYPKTHNPSYTKAVAALLGAVLAEPSSPLLPFVNVGALKGLMDSGQAAFNIPWFGQLMTGPQLFAYLLQVDYWLREYDIVVEI